ncbi:hypothetical protein NQ315_010111 [Exocentrus adspersus]|uniref:Mid1-interacting protein 1 n=1 Tax=Exocentrus adspersus TaxID=1586481 RepID=A0AAV8WAF0_9CUCU|nr:hypothetical protein NQ315_010111 [Exocentrus adspersus]
MEKFVKTVNKMDETILVPCRLMDQKVGDEHDPACVQNMKAKTPHTVHELFSHIRRPSTVSVASINSSSSTMSDTDSESGSNENDSGIEEPSTQEEGKVDRVAHDFRKHLHGLTSSLRQMTEAAQYLTWRYQYDIGGPV